VIGRSVRITQKEMSVKFKGEPVTINGTFPQPGEHARDFQLTGKDLKDVSLNDFKGLTCSLRKRDADAGKTKILNIVPSLDTPVCSLSAKKFNTKVF
jgi:thiol peroxidase